jgi:hypothetical protein
LKSWEVVGLEEFWIKIKGKKDCRNKKMKGNDLGVMLTAT